MDILNMIGIAVAPIAGIIMACEVIKRFDKEGKLKKIYSLMPIILSVLTAFIFMQHKTYISFLQTAFLNAAASAYLYDIVVKTIKSRSNENK